MVKIKSWERRQDKVLGEAPLPSSPACSLSVAMAPKLFVCLALLCLFPSISRSSYDELESIASAPSTSSLQGSTESSRLRSFSSLVCQHFPCGSRKLQNGFSKGRLAAEVGTATASSMAPAVSPSSMNNGKPSPSSISHGKPSSEKTKKNPSAVRWLAGIALGALTGSIAAIVASFLFGAIRNYVNRPKPGKPVVFQRKVIDAKAIEFLGKPGAMESLEFLGRGGSGEVYKTTLENGKAVAIKRVLGFVALNDAGADPLLGKSFDLTKNSAQIFAELNTLGQIRHRNLITLLAYIPQPSAHMLIYDYMENGSLHDAIISVAENKLELPWPKRLEIARDVATGLQYLHFECTPKIIHCDMKPGNILLDKDMVAHIGDFGLAKVIPDKQTHITGSNMAGTVGYIAPEYYQMLRYTTYGDIYGFGVVLVVLLTGKEPSHPFFANLYTHMGDWVANTLASGDEIAMGVFDATLRGHGNEEAMILALKVAVFCLHENPRERPDAKDVLKMLNQIGSSKQKLARPVFHVDAE